MEGPVWITFMGTSPEGIQNTLQVVYTLFQFHGHCRERWHMLWHSYHSPKCCKCPILFLLRLVLYQENFRDLTELSLNTPKGEMNPTSWCGYKKEFFSLNNCPNKISDYNSFFHKSLTICHALNLTSINLDIRKASTSVGHAEFI